MFSDIYEIERAFRDGDDWNSLRRAATPPPPPRVAGAEADRDADATFVSDAPSIVSAMPEDHNTPAPRSIFASWMTRVKNRVVDVVTTGE
jgi:hypothetical protein